jgi:hypothetical protein
MVWRPRNPHCLYQQQERFPLPVDDPAEVAISADHLDIGRAQGLRTFRLSSGIHVHVEHPAAGRQIGARSDRGAICGRQTVGTL